jgi:hypothetical protein
MPEVGKGGIQAGLNDRKRYGDRVKVPAKSGCSEHSSEARSGLRGARNCGPLGSSLAYAKVTAIASQKFDYDFGSRGRLSGYNQFGNVAASWQRKTAGVGGGPIRSRLDLKQMDSKAVSVSFN